MMKKAINIAAVLLISGAIGYTYGQNLVQNAGFEAVTDWDSLWVLSMELPSTITAVAAVNTTEAHAGFRSVQLSNTKFNSWTYLYSDSINAPLALEAGRSYRVSGWLRSIEQGKSSELSIAWNSSRESLIFYSGNPDPVSDPGWFEVSDTITPMEAYGDGYLSLGFRSDKQGQEAPGILLLDDFSVVRIPDNDETDILSFSIPEQTGPAIIDPVAGTVLLEVQAEADLKALAADIISLSRGATVTPAAGDTVDFSGPVSFIVVAQDGITSREWTVTVTRLPSSRTDLVSFSLPEKLHEAVIDNVLHIVMADVVYGTDITALVPVIELAPGATLNPAGGVPTDFSSPIVYRVTAENGINFQDYIISVTVSTLLNETEITAFSLVEETGPATIDPVQHTVDIEVPSGTDLTALVPTIALSSGASVNPSGGVANDFSVPAVYTVTAEDGITMQDWTVTVSLHYASETDITAFTLAEEAGPATIDPVLHTVDIAVPSGTDVTALVPTIVLSDGATVDPAGGTATDFTDPVVYTVTAEDGTTMQEWIVTLVVLPSQETDITSFTLSEEAEPATIDPVLHTVEIAVQAGMDVTALVPTIVLSDGATVDPSGGTATDFTGPVVYTVTAEDGITTQDWTVTVVVILRTGTSIIAFTMTEQTGPAAIDEALHTVEIEVEKGTGLTALVPDITISDGATVNPASGVAGDFSSDVVYSVTAEDAITTQDWVVTVTVDPALFIENDPAVPSGLKIYPNPAREVLHVELDHAGELYLCNILGRIVASIPDASDHVDLPVANFDRGIYFLQYLVEGKKQVFRIILE